MFSENCKIWDPGHHSLKYNMAQYVCVFTILIQVCNNENVNVAICNHIVHTDIRIV